MIAYWSLFVLSLIPQPRQHLSQQIFWTITFLILVVIIGFRLEVGCDWGAYYKIYRNSQTNIYSAMQLTDPGYALINWLAGWLGGGYHLANTLAASLFTAGLLTFIRRQPLPMLALTIAVPYMIVVVAMGYTRQAVALGFLMVAFTRLRDDQNIAFFFYVLVGALFHKTVVVLLPLGLIGAAKGHGLTKWFAFGFAVWAGSILILDSYSTLWTNYVESKMESEGALIRVSMNVVAALAFFTMKKRWDRQYNDGHIWEWVAWASLASMPLLLVATTAVDRMALYFLPLQIIVFCRLPLLVDHKQTSQILTAAITAGYAAVLFVWLNYAVHARCWVPYKNALEPEVIHFFKTPAKTP